MHCLGEIDEAPVLLNRSGRRPGGFKQDLSLAGIGRCYDFLGSFVGYLRNMSLSNYFDEAI